MTFPAGEIQLREAEPSDANMLSDWDNRSHVIASDPNDDWNWKEELSRRPSWRGQLVAEVNGRPVGFLQIIDAAEEETHYWGDISPGIRAIDIWIGEEDAIGRGIGTAMMRMAIDRCFADQAVTSVVVDPLASNTRAHRFYERLGFELAESRRFGEDDCLVFRLDRAKWIRSQQVNQSI